MNVYPNCNGYLLYLLILATLILDQFCEAQERTNKRNKKRDNLFISSHYQDSKYDPSQFSSVHKYKVRLYSKASESNIRILGRRRIDSLGKMESADSILVIETVAFGVIRIRGHLSGLYLCMNKKGHLVARKTLKFSRCAFIIEDDHLQAYKRYVSLAYPSYRIAFNKNGRPRTATRVPNRNHRSVLFVEKRLVNYSDGIQSRTRRHGQRKSQKDPCRPGNKLLLSNDMLKLWTEYCKKKTISKPKVGDLLPSSR